MTHSATGLGANGADGDYIEQVTYDRYGRTFQTFQNRWGQTRSILKISRFYAFL